MKKSSRKVPMSTPSKSGGGIDSHSSSSNSSCGTVGTLSSGGGGSAALPSSGPATKGIQMTLHFIIVRTFKKNGTFMIAPLFVQTIFNFFEGIPC